MGAGTLKAAKEHEEEIWACFRLLYYYISFAPRQPSVNARSVQAAEWSVGQRVP